MLVQMVLDAARREAATIAPTADIAEAAKLLTARDAHIVVVVDDDKKVQGVLTDHDVASLVADCAGQQHACMTPVADVMTRDVVSCRRSDRVEQVLETMARRRLRYLPVLDENGRVAGLLTMRDALRQLYDEAKGDTAMLRDYIVGAGYH